jgi:hypothetical protein
MNSLLIAIGIISVLNAIVVFLRQRKYVATKFFVAAYLNFAYYPIQQVRNFESKNFYNYRRYSAINP